MSMHSNYMNEESRTFEKIDVQNLGKSNLEFKKKMNQSL